jgi:arginase
MGDRATKDSETIGDFLRRAQTDKSRAKSDGQSCLPERDKNKLRAKLGQSVHHSLNSDSKLLHDELVSLVDSQTILKDRASQSRVAELGNVLTNKWDDRAKNWRSQLKLAEFHLKIGNPWEFDQEADKVNRLLALKMLKFEELDQAKSELKELYGKYRKHPVINRAESMLYHSSQDSNGRVSTAPLIAGGACAIGGATIGALGFGVSAAAGAAIGFGACAAPVGVATRVQNYRDNSFNVRNYEEVKANSWQLPELTLELAGVVGDVTGAASMSLQTLRVLGRVSSIIGGAKKIALIGYASDLAGPAEKFGAAAGPDALRELGAVASLGGSRKVVDFGNAVPERLNVRIPFGSDELKAHNLEEVFSATKTLHDKVTDALSQKHLPVIIGGDHSQSLGSISAIANHFNSSVGVIWIDAHADINTFFASGSKNIHGMPLSVLAGLDKTATGFRTMQKVTPAVKTENLVYIGLRDPDPFEVETLKQLNITYFGPEEIKRLGMNEVLKQAAKIASGDRSLPAVISFDLDSLDPLAAPGVSTDVKNGLSLENGKYAIAYLMNKINNVAAVEVVEYNRRFDTPDQRTGKAALDLFRVVGRNR